MKVIQRRQKILGDARTRGRKRCRQVGPKGDNK